MSEDRTGPVAESSLRGVRVVEGSAFVAAPLGGMTLAQMGADVIRVDTVGGGLDYHRWPVSETGNSFFWAGLNKGKRSVVADLRSPEGRELVQELVTAPGPESGIFLSNFPASGWLADDVLRSRRKDLVYVERHRQPGWVHGGGLHSEPVERVRPGHWADRLRPAHEPRPAGMGHHVWPARCAGRGRRAPAAVGDGGGVVPDHLAGRHRDGHGGEPRLPRPGRAVQRESSINRERPVRSIRSRLPDGRRIMVVAITLRQWYSLVEATGIGPHLGAIEAALDVDLTLEGDRFRARDAIAAFIAPWVESRSLGEVREAFDHHGVAWGPYQTFKQLAVEDWRCSTKNPIFHRMHQPGIGDVLVPSSPIRNRSVEQPEPMPAPLLGQHTVEVLAEVLGLTQAEIGNLHDRRVVASAEPEPS